MSQSWILSRGERNYKKYGECIIGFEQKVSVQGSIIYFKVPRCLSFIVLVYPAVHYRLISSKWTGLLLVFRMVSHVECFVGLGTLFFFV